MGFEEFFDNYIKIKNEVEKSIQDPKMEWSFDVSNNFADKKLIGNIIVRIGEKFSVSTLFEEEFEMHSIENIASRIVRTLTRKRWSEIVD